MIYSICADKKIMQKCTVEDRKRTKMTMKQMPYGTNAWMPMLLDK